MQQGTQGGRKAVISAGLSMCAGVVASEGQARRMNSKVRQQVMAAKGGNTRWKRLLQQGGREGGGGAARGLAGGLGWTVEVWKWGGREGGRGLRRGSAEATVARLAIRGGLAATAAGALA